MPILIIFIVWYVIAGRNNPKVYKNIGDKIPKIIVGLIILSMCTSFIPSLLGLSIALAVALAFTVGPIVFTIWLIKKALGKNSKNDKKDDYKYYQEHYKDNDTNKPVEIALVDGYYEISASALEGAKKNNSIWCRSCR